MTTYEQVTADLRRAYNQSAAQRDATEIAGWKLDEVQNFLSYLRQEGKRDLLEVGAGPGHYSRYFADQGFSVTCTDLSPEMVRLCRAKGLTAYEMDFLHLDFSAESFDAVFALNCLLHVPSPDLPRVLEAIGGILRPGSLFYMGVYGGRAHEGVWEEDYHDPKRFFTFYPDWQLLDIVMSQFELLYFRQVEVERGSELHFQSLILRASKGFRHNLLENDTIGPR
jgi:SAM-dependent methyltransferase